MGTAKGMSVTKIVSFSIQLGEIEISLRVEPVWGNTPQSAWGRAETLNSGHTVWDDSTKMGKKENGETQEMSVDHAKSVAKHKKQQNDLGGLLGILFALFMMILGKISAGDFCSFLVHI